MMPSYDYWRDALAGKQPKAFVDQPEVGFYKKAIYEKQPNKAAKRIGWEPVAIFHNGKQLVAVIGPANNAKVTYDPYQINDVWTFCCNKPISESVYRLTAEQCQPFPEQES